MKTKDIAKQYGIDQARFEGYLRATPHEKMSHQRLNMI